MSSNVSTTAEFKDGEINLTEVDGVAVGVVQWRGKYYAFRDLCPHMLGPMVAGTVGPRLVCAGRPGTLDADESQPTVTCPWHRWQFDLQTGRPLWDMAGPRLSMYHVEVSDGTVRVMPRKGT